MSAGKRHAVESFPAYVLDATGVGLVAMDDTGHVVLQNAIADELLTRRVGDTSLLAILVDQIKTPTPIPTESAAGHDQQKVEVYDAADRKSIIGYRIVRCKRLGIIVTLRDITEDERVRTEQRRLERLSQLGKACAMVAHELGNPLAAIKATIQSIEPEVRAAGLQDPIAAVYSEIDRLDIMLNQLLGFVRHRTPRKTNSDVVSIVNRASNTVAGRLGGVALSATYGKLRPVFVDPDQIEQVLINLFLNAVDAQPGGGSILVHAAVADDKLTIRVDDEGAGISPALRQQVFESFYTTKQSGTGLGLPICYRIISEHGGTIAIEGRRKRGASIVITLPVRAGR